MPDNIDQKILRLLKKDSRMSNVAIAKEIGLTEGAVRRRIEKLVEDGTIKSFTINVSSGSEIYAVLMAKANGETKKMMTDISQLTIHADGYEISGEYDGCIVIDAPTMDELDKKIDQIRKLKSVADTRTFISFRRY